MSLGNSRPETTSCVVKKAMVEVEVEVSCVSFSSCLNGFGEDMELKRKALGTIIFMVCCQGTVR